MISQIEGRRGTRRRSSARAYQIRVALLGPEPEIWRRILVPGDANLGWLHAVIQVAMGWTNSHLHLYDHDGQVFSGPAAGLGSSGGGPPVKDEGKFRLSGVLKKPGEILRYTYDLGDSWDHLLEFEEARDSDPAAAGKAICVAGARACPPEDCGGFPGYDELLKALKNPKHPEHRSMKEWLGRPFKPERFSIDEVNPWLSKLRWPRVTEAALRRVLIARDGG
jgi:hypothetical protein